LKKNFFKTSGPKQFLQPRQM